ncbi:MAG: twin-arginine translocation signal domain-containing protein, partial [Betaproteobacteria bacterium]
MPRTNRLDTLIAKAISRRQFLQATTALAASG